MPRAAHPSFPPTRRARRAALLVAPVALVALCACRSGGAPRHVPAEGALGPYSAAVVAGDLCFVSGKIGRRGGTFAEEVESAIDAVEEVLAGEGLGLGDVVVATVYLTDMNLYGELNEIYGRRFPAPYPARACIAVRELPGEARVEIMVTASTRRRGP